MADEGTDQGFKQEDKVVGFSLTVTITFTTRIEILEITAH